MSTNPPPVIPVVVQPAPAYAPRPRRHALGLPAGSVRAMLALSLLTLLALIVFLPGDKENEPSIQSLYVYLWAMLFLAIAHFFTAHGRTLAVPEVHTASPLGLPRGSVRLLLLVGLGGIVVWLYHTNRLFRDAPTMQVSMLVVIPVGFFVGYLLDRFVRLMTPGHDDPFWFQDVEAWVALVSMLILLVLALIHLFINPSLADESLKINPTQLEGALIGLVSFYFGARS